MSRSWFGIRGLGIAAFTAVLATSLAGCSSSAPPPLYAAGGDLSPGRDHLASGNTFASARGEMVSVEVQIYVCTRTSPITVDSVTLHHPSQGLVLGRWGISNALPGGDGETSGPLLKLGVYQSRRVTVHCAHGNDWAYIAVELTRTSVGPARTMGYDVHYTHGGSRRDLWLGYATELTTPGHA